MRDLGDPLDKATIEGIETIDEATARMSEVEKAFGYDNFTILDIVYSEGKPQARVILDDATPERPMHLKDFDRDERRSLFAGIAASSVPTRWRSRSAPPVAPIVASRHLFQDSPIVSSQHSGLCIPVHSGLNRAGVVIFFGDGKPDLTLAEVGSLRLFCMSWYSKLSRLTLDQRAYARITRRELECLQCAANGMTSEAIGAALDLSKHTVTHHLVSVTLKLGANNRTHAIAEAVRMGLIR